MCDSRTGVALGPGGRFVWFLGRWWIGIRDIRVVDRIDQRKAVRAGGGRKEASCPREKGKLGAETRLFLESTSLKMDLRWCRGTAAVPNGIMVVGAELK